MKTSFKSVVPSGGYCVSCIVKDGRIIPALTAIKQSGKPPQNVEFCAYSAGLKKFFVIADGYLYVSPKGVNVDYTDSLPAENAYFFEEQTSDGTRRAVIGQSDFAYMFTSASLMPNMFSQGFSCAAMRRHRLFAVSEDDPYKIVWSGADEYSDPDEGLKEGGWLRLDPEYGEVLDLLQFNDSLIAVRRFGLTVLRVYGSPENFSVGADDLASAEIYKGTAKTVGDKLYFITRAGVRTYDGTKVEERACGYFSDISSPSNAAAYGGGYFVCCNSAKLSRRVILYLGEEGDYIIDLPASAVCAADGIYAFCDDGLYKLERGGEFLWFGGGMDFGTGGFKALTSVKAFGGADIILSADGKNRILQKVDGKVRAGLRGRRFYPTVMGRNEVYGLTFTAEVADGI